MVAAVSSAWTLDLCPECANALTREIAERVPDGRPSHSRSLNRFLERGGLPQQGAYRAAEGISMGEVRAWAHANNVEVAATGRVSAEVIRAFREATGR